MKYLYASLFATLFASASVAQNLDWTKEDRNSVFEEGMNATTKYKTLTKDQRESIALCFLEEITKKYNKKDFQSKIEIELKRIYQSTVLQCSKNIGVNLEIPAEPVPEPVAAPKPSAKVHEGNFTRNDIIGIWRDENSKLYLNEDATFLIKWDNGKSEGGKWWINSEKEIVLERFSKLSLISFDGKTMKYQQQRGVRKFKEIYTATRVQ